MDEQPASVKAEKVPTPPYKPQGEPRPSYLDTVLSYPSQPTAPGLPLYDPYTSYRPTSFRPTALSTTMGLNNTTSDTLVMPPVSITTPVSSNIPSSHDYPVGAFCIDCNNCGKSIPNEHYHCSICDAGDFDLCQGCIDRGVTCDGNEHWLIKRSIKGGRVIPSITETIEPKKAGDKTAETQDMKERIPLNEYEDESVAERTCNSCIRGKLISGPGRDCFTLTFVQNCLSMNLSLARTAPTSTFASCAFPVTNMAIIQGINLSLSRTTPRRQHLES
jgi:hypothetical protein